MTGVPKSRCRVLSSLCSHKRQALLLLIYLWKAYTFCLCTIPCYLSWLPVKFEGLRHHSARNKLIYQLHKHLKPSRNLIFNCSNRKRATRINLSLYSFTRNQIKLLASLLWWAKFFWKRWVTWSSKVAESIVFVRWRLKFFISVCQTMLMCTVKFCVSIRVNIMCSQNRKCRDRSVYTFITL